MKFRSLSAIVLVSLAVTAACTPAEQQWIDKHDPVNPADSQACALSDGGVLYCRRSDQTCPTEGNVCSETIQAGPADGAKVRPEDKPLVPTTAPSPTEPPADITKIDTTGQG